MTNKLTYFILYLNRKFSQDSCCDSNSYSSFSTSSPSLLSSSSSVSLSNSNSSYQNNSYSNNKEKRNKRLYNNRDCRRSYSREYDDYNDYELNRRRTRSNSKIRERGWSSNNYNNYKYNNRRKNYRSRYEKLPITYWQRSDECLEAKHRHVEKIDRLCESREMLVLYTTLYNKDIALEKNMFPCTYFSIFLYFYFFYYSYFDLLYF